MKKIGVIGDTHIPIYGLNLPERVYEIFQGVEMILHTGDLIRLKALEPLKKIAPVKAVQGNMDWPKVRKSLPEKELINIDKFRVGLIHGWGGPAGIVERIRGEFDEVDCIVFGHTHHPMNEIINGVLFFNPGSPIDHIFAPYNAIGILEIGEAIEGKIIRL